jgi:hypothetical protein
MSSNITGLEIFTFIFLLMNASLLYFSFKSKKYTDKYCNDLQDKDPIELQAIINTYVEFAFNNIIIDKFTIRRRRDEPINEDFVDDIIINESMRIASIIPNKFKEEFLNTFKGLEEPEMFMMELIMQNLRSRIGGLK